MTNDNAFLCGKSIHMSANALYCTLNVTITYSVPRLWSCNSNLLTCTFLLCNLLKECTCVRKHIAQFFFYYAICTYSRISRLLTLTFSFLNLLSNFMKISQYRKRKKKFYSQKTWRSQMRYYTVTYSYLDILSMCTAKTSYGFTRYVAKPWMRCQALGRQQRR